MGRSAGQAEKRFKRGVPERVIDMNHRLFNHAEATSIQDRVYAPSEEEIRRCIGNGVCPFCGRGGFRNLALHVNKTHGIGRREFKDMAGLPLAHPACSPEHSALRSELWRASGVKPPGPKGNKRILSRLGREAARRNSQRQSVESRNRGAEKARQTNLEKTAERDRRIVEMIQGGSLANEVAAQLGVSRNLVTTVLKRRGVNVNLRKARMERPEIRKRAVAAMATGYAKVQRQPCGTRAAYRRGCRCTECDGAYRSYKREQSRKARLRAKGR